MKVSLIAAAVASILFFARPSAGFFNFLDDAATSDELAAMYPTVADNVGNDRPGNPRILCPFLRLVERSGRLDGFILTAQNNTSEKVIANRELKPATDEFGCDTLTGCGLAIVGVSTIQALSHPSSVDLFRLWDVSPISHGCGFSFQAPGQSVDETQLAKTLTELYRKNFPNNGGQLSYQDLVDVKFAVCPGDTSLPGRVETQLVFAYLGGVDRGFVEYDDVVRFLSINTTLPVTKASKPISAFYLTHAH